MPIEKKHKATEKAKPRKHAKTNTLFLAKTRSFFFYRKHSKAENTPESRAAAKITRRAAADRADQNHRNYIKHYAAAYLQ